MISRYIRLFNHLSNLTSTNLSNLFILLQFHFVSYPSQPNPPYTNIRIL